MSSGSYLPTNHTLQAVDIKEDMISVFFGFYWFPLLWNFFSIVAYMGLLKYPDRHFIERSRYSTGSSTWPTCTRHLPFSSCTLNTPRFSVASWSAYIVISLLAAKFIAGITLASFYIPTSLHEIF